MILIKNVKIIDGSGKPAYPADVLVAGDKISAIGNFPHRQADRIIEGLGGHLTPGFIDVNTDSDHQLTLLTDPGQRNVVLQGVTTIIGGHCGSSLAPLLYGALESVRKWADINQVNVNWHTVGEFFQTIKKLRLGVNFGTLVGHSTIRRALIGEQWRDLTEKELRIFQAIIRESLEAGALGLSTGLGFAHSQRTTYRELKLLAGVLSRYGAVYSTHLRDEGENIYSAVHEILKLHQETGVKTLISHFHPLKKFEKEFDAALDLLNKAGWLMDIHFDLAPFETSIIPIYTLLPLWARQDNLEMMLERLNQPDLAKKITKELPLFKKGDLIIAQAGGGYEFLAGKEIAAAKGLLEIMRLTRLRALLFYKNIDYRRLSEIIFSEKAMIASHSGGLGEQATGTFTKFLEMAGQRKNYPLETAIAKITFQPVQKFNIKSRGLIKEGYFADLALLINNRVQYVIINGQVAVHKGDWLDTAAGRIV